MQSQAYDVRNRTVFQMIPAFPALPLSPGLVCHQHFPFIHHLQFLNQSFCAHLTHFHSIPVLLNTNQQTCLTEPSFAQAHAPAPPAHLFTPNTFPLNTSEYIPAGLSECSLAQAHVPATPAQNPAVLITVYHSHQCHHPLTFSTDNLGLWFTRFEARYHISNFTDKQLYYKLINCVDEYQLHKARTSRPV